MKFGSETWLLAEMPEARQHFFLFFPDFLFFTRLLSPGCRASAKAGEGASFT
jgi:hypothetical protein